MKEIHTQRTPKLGAFALSPHLEQKVRNHSRPGQLGRLLTTCSLFLLFAATAIAAPAATKFKSLVSFDVANGLNPAAPVTQGLDGNLYGTTEFGGANLSCNAKGVGCGTVFQITPTGKLTTLYSFCSKTSCADGAYPLAGLTVILDGDLNGTTSSGGANGFGSVFKITPNGTLTTVYSFCSVSGCADGLDPAAPLIQSIDGNFYGTTVHGGTGGCGGCHGGGTIFKLTPGGKLTTLLSFCRGGNCADGAYPSAGLLRTLDGSFYGTTLSGGTNGDGTVFKINPAGKLTTLYSFCSISGCADGINPVAPLIQGTDGNFYGTTDGDDSNNGNVFKITPAGKLTSLYNFAGSGDGGVPESGLIQGADGNFYGTTLTAFHDANCCGTVFKITPAGKLTTLHTFNGTDGGTVFGLFQDTSGTFYGVTSMGGANNQGTVFSISVGLKPFVELVPTFGKVKDTIDVLGQGLTGTTAVSFNGTAATFNVVAGTYLTAVVPSGTSLGAVTVTAPGGALASNSKFIPVPHITNFTPASGAVGTSVSITGSSFTGAIKVTFGGVKATTFSVKSDTLIKATVPAGAVTGKIAVTTPDGTATSSGIFTVTQ